MIVIGINDEFLFVFMGGGEEGIFCINGIGF